MLPSTKDGVPNPVNVVCEGHGVPTALNIVCDSEGGDDADDHYELVTDPTIREYNNNITNLSNLHSYPYTLHDLTIHVSIGKVSCMSSIGYQISSVST